MTRTCAADDFDTIRARMREVSLEKEPCVHTWDHNRICTKCKTPLQHLIDTGDACPTDPATDNTGCYWSNLSKPAETVNEYRVRIGLPPI